MPTDENKWLCFILQFFNNLNFVFATDKIIIIT